MKNTSRSRWLLRSAILASGILVSALTWPITAAAQGCAMCATVVGGAADPLSQGINTSILFMLSMPFVMTACVVAWIVYMHRRAGVRFDSMGQLELQGEEAS